MVKLKNKDDWPLIRFIVPAFPEINIFSRYAEKMTSLGLIMVATAASKLWGWRVEVIDENNYRGPLDIRGLPDHAKLQKENPASVVGFYCGLTSTINRVFWLADFYHDQGVVNIAGGWHVHYCPEEALNNNINVVVHGDGEIAIQQILNTIKDRGSFVKIPGISFWEKNQQKTNGPAMLELPYLNDLPYPDFGLLRYAKKIKIYPIGRIRGCRMNCEFCSVKGIPRWAGAQYLFKIVNWLIETRGAHRFFVVDDRLEEDTEGTLEFFRMIAAKYGNQLRFAVQIRLEVAENTEFLETLKAAGVRTVCVGYESPIDKDLKTMRKGYLSSNMIKWTRVLRRYFWVHGMFIFGYPPKEKKNGFSAEVMGKRFKSFIRQSHIDSIQIIHPLPLVGTELRERLKEEGRIFSQDLVSWSRYDGSYACFIPDNMTLAELQEIPLKIMKWFYSPLSFLRIHLKTIAFPLDYFIRGWRRWHKGWLRDIVKYSGHLLVQRWQRKQRNNLFLSKLEQHKKTMH